jgi:hypothetical protein
MMLSSPAQQQQQQLRSSQGPNRTQDFARGMAQVAARFGAQHYSRLLVIGKNHSPSICDGAGFNQGSNYCCMQARQLNMQVTVTTTRELLCAFQRVLNHSHQH